MAVRWGEWILVGMYFSPNKPLDALDRFLIQVEATVRQSLYGKVIVAGDLNAKSRLWGSSRTDKRGAMVEEWITGLGLVCQNKGTVHTCVRQHGGSVVDVTFMSPAASELVTDWWVEEHVETLSDHRYIRYDLATDGDPSRNRELSHTSNARDRPRWMFSKVDEDAMMAAAIVVSWPEEGPHTEGIDQRAEWFRESMTAVCNASMPRAGLSKSRRNVYWWSSAIAELRIKCVSACRQYVRSRRRANRDLAREATLYERYRQARRTLQLSIKDAKTQAWL